MQVPVCTKMWNRLHGSERVSQFIGDGTFKQAASVDVERFEGACGHSAGDVAAHGKIHIENKLYLGILRRVGNFYLNPTETGVDFCLTAVIQLQLEVCAAGEEILFPDIRLTQNAGVSRSH